MCILTMTTAERGAMEETLRLATQPSTRRERVGAERRRVTRRLRRRDGVVVAALATLALILGLTMSVWPGPSAPLGDDVDAVVDAVPAGWKGARSHTRLTYIPERTGVVTGVAFPVAGGSATSYVVGAWSGRNRLGVATTSPAGGGAGWLEASFSVPLDVRAGERYAIRYWASPRGSSAVDADDVVVSFVPSKGQAAPSAGAPEVTPVPSVDPGSADPASESAGTEGSVTPGSGAAVSEGQSGQSSAGTSSAAQTGTQPSSSTPGTGSSSSGTSEPTGTTSSAPPSAAATTGCAALPSRCGYPDASNTGVRPDVALRKVPGELTEGSGWKWNSSGYLAVTGDGAVLDGLDIDGTLDVSASNVTIQNVRVVEQGESFGIAIRHAENVTIQDSEVYSPDAGDRRLMVGIKDIYGDSVGLTVLRTDVWHTSTGIQVDGRAYPGQLYPRHRLQGRGPS